MTEPIAITLTSRQYQYAVNQLPNVGEAKNLLQKGMNTFRVCILIDKPITYSGRRDEGHQLPKVNHVTVDFELNVWSSAQPFYQPTMPIQIIPEKRDNNI